MDWPSTLRSSRLSGFEVALLLAHRSELSIRLPNIFLIHSLAEKLAWAVQSNHRKRVSVRLDHLSGFLKTNLATTQGHTSANKQQRAPNGAGRPRDTNELIRTAKARWRNPRSSSKRKPRRTLLATRPQQQHAQRASHASRNPTNTAETTG